MPKLAKSSSSTLYCFTPGVSLATFIIEVCFSIYILFAYKMTRFSRLCAIVLLLLGLFQLAEFMICTTPYASFWIKVGLVSITFLPASGLHIASMLTKKNTMTAVGYLIASAFALGIILIPQIHPLVLCRANFVDITTSGYFNILYQIYYSGFILLSIGYLLLALKRHTGDRSEVIWMLIGYFVFFIPAIILYYLQIITQTALPSVMCGFAIFAAVIITFKELPRYYYLSAKKSKKLKK